MEIKVSHDLKKMTKNLNKLERKQIPFATSLALNKTAQKVKRAQRNEMQDVFDRPSRFTLNSVYIDSATKKNLAARVWLKDWSLKGGSADRFLGPQIHGGPRPLKTFEKLLNRRGILPDGFYVVPGKRAKLDRYGNISRGLLGQILSYTNSQRDPLQNTKRGRRGTKAKFILFDARDGKPGGLWQIADNGGVYPVLIFVKNPKYNKRYNFDAVARQTHRIHFPKEFKFALRRALRTAKR